ncbi:MAG TPA: hypothetical protein GX697_02715 [Firmicutes bacterium]|nr:hypothetical protein [Bacillota bacterium]
MSRDCYVSGRWYILLQGFRNHVTYFPAEGVIPIARGILGNSVRYGSFIWFTVTLLFSLMGLGYAAWQDSLNVEGTVGTGNIDVAFADCWLLDEACRNETPAATKVSCTSKCLYIDITGAYPGYNVWLGYEIVNNGSMPVKYEIGPYVGNKKQVLVINRPPEASVLDSGKSAVGKMQVIVRDVAWDSEYNFSLRLDFRQWNLIPAGKR